MLESGMFKEMYRKCASSWNKLLSRWLFHLSRYVNYIYANLNHLTTIISFLFPDCKSSLAQGGFFTQTNEKGKAASYCTKCYQQSFGTKCAACNRFVEGEVVTALGNTYHQHCFRCNRCK